MAGLIHTTKRALWYLSGKLGKRPAVGRSACHEGVGIDNPAWVVGVGLVQAFLSGDPWADSLRIPTCPKCAVLWDQALTAREAAST